MMASVLENAFGVVMLVVALASFIMLVIKEISNIAWAGQTAKRTGGLDRTLDPPMRSDSPN
eukprot:scaffold6285_cov121-Isochrysis_galbana.AAC.17